MVSRTAGVKAAVAALAGVTVALAKDRPQRPAQASVTPRLDTDAVGLPVASFKRASTIASVYPARVSGRFKNGILHINLPAMQSRSWCWSRSVQRRRSHWQTERC